MSKRGAGERDAYTPSQGNLRKARVEVRRVDAIQILMAAARTRSAQSQQQAPPALLGQPTGTTTAAQGAAAAAPGTAAIGPLAPAASAPCTHCGTVLPVSADSCSLRQCCGCLDVFCSLCSVLDYEEREDRVFCLSCLDDQNASSRHNHRGRGGDAVGCAGRATAITAGLSMGLALTGTGGRWGQLDQLGAGPACSPFPCSRTPQHGGTSSSTPGSAIYSSRSHRSFSALLAYGGVGS